jgi:hypothetical protein
MLPLLRDLKLSRSNQKKPLLTEREESSEVERENKEKEDLKDPKERLKEKKPNNLPKLKLLKLNKPPRKLQREREEEVQEKANNDLLK